MARSKADVLETNTRKESNLIHLGAAYRLVGANAREQCSLEKRLDVHTREFNRERKATDRLTRSLVTTANRVRKITTFGQQDIIGSDTSDGGDKRRPCSSLERRIAQRERQLALLRASSGTPLPFTRDTKERFRSRVTGASRSCHSSHSAVKEHCSCGLSMTSKPAVPDVFVQCVDSIRQSVRPTVDQEQNRKSCLFGHLATLAAVEADAASQISVLSPGLSPTPNIRRPRRQPPSQRQDRTLTPANASETITTAAPAQVRRHSSSKVSEDRSQSKSVSWVTGTGSSSTHAIQRPSSASQAMISARGNTLGRGQFQALLSALPVETGSSKYSKRSGKHSVRSGEN